MNIDAWLSGEEGTRVVDAMTAAEDACGYYETVDGRVCHPCGELVSSADGFYALERAWRAHKHVHGLRAALSLTTTCDRCRGTGKVLAFAGVDTTAYYEKASPCPDCKGGTVPGESVLVVRERLERVLNDIEAAYPTDIFRPPPWDEEPASDVVAAESARNTIRNVRYRLRPLEKEDET